MHSRKTQRRKAVAGVGAGAVHVVTGGQSFGQRVLTTVGTHFGWILAVVGGYLLGTFQSAVYYTHQQPVMTGNNNNPLVAQSSSWLGPSHGTQRRDQQTHLLTCTSPSDCLGGGALLSSTGTTTDLAAAAATPQSSRHQHPLGDKPRHAFCRRLSSTISASASSPAVPTALELWFQHYTAIHAASRLVKNDKKYKFHDFTAELLQLISPRLPRSVLTLSTDWHAVQRILTKAEARYQYLVGQQQQPPPSSVGAEEQPHNSTTATPPPPVKIVILGGSVLVGRNCRKLVRDLKLELTLPMRECTYSNRLQNFLDQFLSMPDLVQITKIAMGGTNTAVGSQILRYDLMPPEAHDPDIVINAYGTNDMHILTVLEAQTGNQTLRQRVFEMTQDFVRAVLQPRPCGKHPPLLFHMDDYLGNEQRHVMATTEMAQGVGVLAGYYGIGSMSYANVVRDLVYGDTRERWFSPEGWWPTAKSAQMEREIHPGMGMHIVSTWIVLFNLLQTVTTFCSLERYWEPPSATMMQYEQTWAGPVIPLGEWVPRVPGKPQAPPSATLASALPPPLTPDLSLETISQQWASDSQRTARSLQNVDCTQASTVRCFFSWVSGLSLQHNNLEWIQNYFAPHVETAQGWTLKDENGKIGYMATQPGARLVLHFEKLAQPINTITFFYLRSYGEKWEGSRVRTSILVLDNNGKGRTLRSTALTGAHNKTTSEMYTDELALPEEISVGGSFRIVFKLVGGLTFKLMGLAVCR